MRPTIDARGLSCPQPVVMTNKVLATANQVTVIVDNAAAVENVTRLARSQGFSVEKAERADGIVLDLRRQGAPVESAPAEPGPLSPGAEPTAAVSVPFVPTAGAPILFVPSDSLGRGSAELGERLTGAFFTALLEVEPKPKRIIFMNSGVKLTVDGSRALDDLRALSEQGIDILACGTCLSYFELMDKLAVGRVSNMYEIATLLLQAPRVVQL